VTTFVAFAPNNQQSPPFSAVFTLDGTQYNAAATWNVYGQRWYLTLTDQAGNLAWNGALVGSPLDADIMLAPGLFTISTLLYREATAQFEVSP
jgi:hypothetical protein